MFASQAAVSPALVQRSRLAQAVLRERGTEFDEVIRLVGALTERGGPRREAGLRLIAVLADLLEPRPPPGGGQTTRPAVECGGCLQ